MLENKFNLLQLMKENKDTISVDSVMDLVIDNFINELIGESDIKLLKMVFSEAPSQKELNDFLAEYDIEAAGADKSLLLSYFMKMHPELSFNEYNGPRLKGLLNFYKFQNMKLISHFTKICNELKKENIKILLFKGGAMKHLRPEFSRLMGDIDVLVPEKDWKKAGFLANKMGYDCAWDIHSVDLHPKDSEEGIMDIHKYIHMETGYEKSINEDLFKRAKETKAFGVDVLIPLNEDLFFITLVNMFRNLRNKTSIKGILYALFDSKFLIDSKSDFDWNIVKENARKTKTEFQLCFAMRFINKIVPNLLPDKIKDNGLFEQEVRDYCTLLMYQRFFLWQMKMKSHELKVKDVFSSFDKFVEYLKLKPKYFILKLFIFRKNPALARLILKLDEKYHIGEGHDN